MPDFDLMYNAVHRFGFENEVRGMKVREVLSADVDLWYGHIPRRDGDNPAIGFVEGLQFIAGTAELGPMLAAAPKARHELFGLSSYYGPRTAAQFPRVIEELRANPGTRRAVLLVAHPDDSPETIPCTTSIQFQHSFRDSDRLHVTVSMRSSDLVWGMPYDMVQFGMVSQAVACCVGAESYSLRITTNNAHIYDETAVHPDAWRRSLYNVPVRYHEWSEWVAWARELVYRTPALTRNDLTNYFRVQDMTKAGGDYVE